MDLQLIVGNRNYSSWSLRAGLYMRESGIPYKEIRIPLFTPEWPERIRQYSPAARVPVLVHGELSVWDTQAIFEYIRETFDQAVGWPQEAVARAEARSVSAEMHSGFLGIREHLPQNIRKRGKIPLTNFSAGTQKEISRVFEIWKTCFQKYGGPWLFGNFSIADVMYAPVALRFVTYGISVPEECQWFIQAVTELPSVQEWTKLSEQESEVLDFIDNLLPAKETPLNLG